MWLFLSVIWQELSTRALQRHWFSFLPPHQQSCQSLDHQAHEDQFGLNNDKGHVGANEIADQQKNQKNPELLLGWAVACEQMRFRNMNKWVDSFICHKRFGFRGSQHGHEIILWTLHCWLPFIKCFPPMAKNSLSNHSFFELSQFHHQRSVNTQLWTKKPQKNIVNYNCSHSCLLGWPQVHEMHCHNKSWQWQRPWTAENTSNNWQWPILSNCGVHCQSEFSQSYAVFVELFVNALTPKRCWATAKLLLDSANLCVRKTAWFLSLCDVHRKLNLLSGHCSWCDSHACSWSSPASPRSQLMKAQLLNNFCVYISSGLWNLSHHGQIGEEFGFSIDLEAPACHCLQEQHVWQCPTLTMCLTCMSQLK